MGSHIAINAQIDPYEAGGTESNLRSLLAEPAQIGDGYRVSVLALPAFANDFRKLLHGHAGVVSWKLGGEILGSGKYPPARRGQGLRLRLGRADVLFDAAVSLYRRARYGAPPTSPTELAVDAALRERRIDAVHFPSPQIFRTSLPFIYEPWDLLFRHYPGFFDSAETLFREQVYRYGCERAELIVTATRWVKDDIVRQFGVDPGKIAVIRRGSEYAMHDVGAAESDRLLSPFGLPAQFAYFPAMSFEHKNHVRLLQALAHLRDRRGLQVSLVLTGRAYEPYWPIIAQTIEALGLRTQVRCLGVVGERALAALYRRARFLVFPSLFEGLGLPVLEAMRHRLPVLAARETSLPEVVGRAGELFDGRDVHAIAAALERAWRSPEPLRERLRYAAEQLSIFDWARARGTFQACYRHLLRMPLREEQAAMLQAALA